MQTPDEYSRRLSALLAKPLFVAGRCVVHPGWIGIAERFADAVGALPGGVAVRVEAGEKFGFWKVYYNYRNLGGELRKEVRRLVSEAEEESSRICIVCGKEGEVVPMKDDVWFLALCPEHRLLTRDSVGALLDECFAACNRVGETGHGKPA